MERLAKRAEVADIVPGRFVFAAMKSYDDYRKMRHSSDCVSFSIDDDLVYEPFAEDFGPLNAGCTYRFCHRAAELLQEAERKKRLLCFYCGPHPEAKANAAVLVGAFMVLLLNQTTEAAYCRLHPMEPFMCFRDASSGPSCFGLTVHSTIQGLAKAKLKGLLDMKCFDIADFETYEKVENGDSTWIIPGKLLAFSGPAAVATAYYGFKTKVPEDYWKYFKRKGVSAVVRLNKPLYDANRFQSGGFRHYELYFPDGSCPSEKIIDAFLAIAERESGALAIHCKAGLGRTGVLICCYLMKHHGFTALEALGYIRVCRPGSVIGPQQNFVVAQEPRMRAAAAKFQREQVASVSLKQDGKPSVSITASCQIADAPPQRQASAEPQAPTTPLQAATSRFSALLRFKPPTVKGMAGGTARATAPNGQPRKIPAALLAAGQEGLRAFAADEEPPTSPGADHWRIATSQGGRGDEFSPLASALQQRT